KLGLHAAVVRHSAASAPAAAVRFRSDNRAAAPAPASPALRLPVPLIVATVPAATSNRRYPVFAEHAAAAGLPPAAIFPAAGKWPPPDSTRNPVCGFSGLQPARVLL